jgi:hypothetical protein
VLGNEMLHETNRRDCDHEFVCLDFRYSPKEFVMYFGVHLVAIQFRHKMSATAAPFEWLSTVNHRRIAVSVVVKPKAECRFLFFILRLRNSSLTLGGLFRCHLHRMTLVLGFATVG